VCLVQPQATAVIKAVQELHALGNVHLLVATRVEGPAAMVPTMGAVVELVPLSEDDGLRVIEAHLGASTAWAADGKDKEAARQLVRLVEANPLVLSIAAGLVGSGRGRLSWQVCGTFLACVQCLHEGQPATLLAARTSHVASLLRAGVPQACGIWCGPSGVRTQMPTSQRFHCVSLLTWATCQAVVLLCLS
jgi:hypothetical protein